MKVSKQTIGNHEFDHSIEGVVPFLETINSPIIAANIDASKEPTMQGKYQNSIIIDRYNRKIGIIGVVLSTYDVSAHEKPCVIISMHSRFYCRQSHKQEI